MCLICFGQHESLLLPFWVCELSRSKIVSVCGACSRYGWVVGGNETV